MVYGVILVKTYPTWCLGQKHYQRVVFWLKITSATSLLGLASCSNCQHFLRPWSGLKQANQWSKER